MQLSRGCGLTSVRSRVGLWVLGLRWQRPQTVLGVRGVAQGTGLVTNQPPLWPVVCNLRADHNIILTAVIAFWGLDPDVVCNACLVNSFKVVRGDQ